MKIKSILLFFILGGTVMFAGVLVNDYVPSKSESEVDEKLTETLMLLSILSILGYAAFMIIRALDIVTGKNNFVRAMNHYMENSRTLYTLN